MAILYKLLYFTLNSYNKLNPVFLFSVPEVAFCFVKDYTAENPDKKLHYTVSKKPLYCSHSIK